MINYILRDENAIFYECGFSCDHAIFLKLSNEAFFITDSRYSLEARESIKNAEVIEAKEDLIKTLKHILRSSKIKKLFYNPKDWLVDDFNKLSKTLKIVFKPSPNFSQKKRAIKTEKEIKYIQKSVQITKNSYDKFANFLKEHGTNKSEKFLHFKAKEILQNYGDYDLSFEPILAINQNAAKPHAKTSNKLLQKGDLLLFDAGVKYKRYCSDRTRTSYFNDSINFNKNQIFSQKKIQKVYDTILKAQEMAIKMIKPGIKASDIDKAAREVIDKAGFGKFFTHSTGHGVGLDIHELPTISQKSQMIIEENMVFTIEPGIYLCDEFGIRVEDIVKVTSTSAQIL